MSITLNWINPNTKPVTINIYRGTKAAPLDRAKLANPITTIKDNKTLTYVDADVVQGTEYQYVIETVSEDGTDKSSTGVMSILAEICTGIGPARIAIGTRAYGYYGQMQPGEFIPTSVLIDQLGLKDIQGLNTVDVGYWYKFSRYGKTFIVPHHPIAYGITWAELYSKGLVFGTDDNGSGEFLPAAKVNQRKVVTYKGFKYIVRLMRGYSDVLTDVPDIKEGFVGDPKDNHRCEYDDLTYPLVWATPDKQRLANAYTASAVSVILSGYPKVLCQEQYSATKVVTRGISTSLTGAGIPTTFTEREVVSARFNDDLTAEDKTKYLCAWRPVFELVEE